MMSDMGLIDTHCHLDFEDFDTDREQVLKASSDAGLIKVIVPATHRKGWERLKSVCDAYEMLHPAYGLHPMFMEHHSESDITELEVSLDRLKLKNKLPIAVGEIGLDYRDQNADKTQQRFYFEQQLIVAQKKVLPVILHVLKAHDEVLSLLKKHQVCGGTVHAFNGSLQQAEQYIELGFKLGFGGMLTYERSTRIRKLATKLPLESIVLETDAPDMTVSQHQYERNSPAYLPYCLEALVELRKESSEAIATQTTRNAMEVFRLQ